MNDPLVREMVGRVRKKLTEREVEKEAIKWSEADDAMNRMIEDIKREEHLKSRSKWQKFTGLLSNDGKYIPKIIGIIFLLCVVVLPFYSCSKEPEKLKLTKAQIEAGIQKDFDEDNSEYCSLLASKYDLTPNIVSEIINFYDKKHGWRNIEKEPSKDYSASLNTLSAQCNVPHKVIASIIIDYKILQPKGE